MMNDHAVTLNVMLNQFKTEKIHILKSLFTGYGAMRRKRTGGNPDALARTRSGNPFGRG
jgi:hypothetical protein